MKTKLEMYRVFQHPWFGRVLTMVLVLACCGCSSAKYSTSNPITLSVDGKTLLTAVEDVALVQQSRLAGYIKSDNRLVLIDANTGEELWGKTSAEGSNLLPPLSVRDGLVHRTRNSLDLYLLSGASASFDIRDSHFIDRGSNDTQFVVSYQNKAEIINMLEPSTALRRLPLAHDAALQAKGKDGKPLPYIDAIHSFFASPTNDVLISLDLLLLKFVRFTSTGVSTQGTPQFSPEQFTLCQAADLNLVADALLKPVQNSDTPIASGEANLDKEKRPVGYALESNFKGIMLRTADERLIYLDFALACEGKNAIKIFQMPVINNTIFLAHRNVLALGASTFGITNANGTLLIFKVTENGIIENGRIEDTCATGVVNFRKYDDRLLLLCGTKINLFDEKTLIEGIKLIDLKNFKKVASENYSDSRELAGIGFDNSYPKLYLLSNSSVGTLTVVDFSGSQPTKEQKSKFILKNILDKL